jgi:hypothetical protein
VAGRPRTWYDLKGLSALDPIDLLVVDGPPFFVGALARYPALPLLWDRLAQDVTILLDDADRPDEREVVRRWCGDHGVVVAERLATERGAVVLRSAVATLPGCGS